MDRLHSLYQHWSWLPHFRAIAETEHLGHAAQLLHVTPPALSRALGRLETALDVRLFDRRGRSLALNDAGAQLLEAVRAAMRHLDDAIHTISTRREPAHLKVSAPGPYNAAVILPALLRARKVWPELRVELVASPPSVAAALIRGEVDLCLHEHVVADSKVVVESISKLQKVVACARRHPAARRRGLRVDDLLAYEFVGPPASVEGLRNDEWPTALERRVGLTVADMQLGVDAVAGGGYLAVLPRPIAVGLGLVPLQVRGLAIPPTQIYASRRRPISTTTDAIPRMIRLVRDELVRLTRDR